jgi:hypothetical protein
MEHGYYCVCKAYTFHVRALRETDNKIRVVSPLSECVWALIMHILVEGTVHSLQYATILRNAVPLK